MSASWYALHTHPNKESFLAEQVEARGFEVFYPVLRAQPVNPRARKIKPYFPGYLFVKADLVQVGLSVFEWMPYTTGFVVFGGEPSEVPEALIHALQRKITDLSTDRKNPQEDIQAGDKVVIQEGLFRGYEAIFDAHITGAERVRILIKMLNRRDVPIELKAGHISKKVTRK